MRKIDGTMDRRINILFIVWLCIYSSCWAIDTTKNTREQMEALYPQSFTEGKSMIQCPSAQGIQPESILSNFDTMKLIAPPSGDRIELPSDITSVYICHSDQTYYAPNDVIVREGGVLVCEPNSLIFWNAGTGLYVDPNGFLSSRGSPDRMVKFVSDMPYMGYWKGIYLYGGDEYSSPSEIIYTHIEGATAGIYLDNISLDSAISYNLIQYCYWGIFSYGPKQTKISNNVIYCCGDWVPTDFGYEPVGVGIEAYHSGYNQIESADSVVEIEFNTLLDNLVAIYIHGTTIEDTAGITSLNHNIYCMSMLYNVVLADGYMQIQSWNNGYYLHYQDSQDTNWDFPDLNPVRGPMDYPLEKGDGWDKFCLTKHSAFIDKGFLLAEQTPYIGASTTLDNITDSGYVDLGFHHHSWDDALDIPPADFTSLWADFDNSATVDVNDLVIFSSRWLSTSFDPNDVPHCDPNKSPDYNQDKIVNIADLSVFSASWMSMEKYIPPSIEFSISYSSEGGLIEVLIKDTEINQYALIVDGIFIKQFAILDYSQSKSFYVPWLLTGNHKARIDGIWNKEIIHSDIVSFPVANRLGRCGTPSSYFENSPIPFFVGNDSNSVIVVSANTYDEGCVWQQTYPAGTACGFVPSSVTDGNDIDFLMFRSSSYLKSNEEGEFTIVAVGSVFRSKKNNIRALIVLPDFKLNTANSGLIGWYKKLFTDRNIPFKTLGCGSSSLKNLKKYNQENHIQYLIMNLHGNYVYPGTKTLLRSVVELDDGVVVSDKKSRPGSPAYLALLPGNDENTVPTLAEVGFEDLKLVYHDGCYGGRLYINSAGQLVEGAPGSSGLLSGPHSDLTNALGLHKEGKLYFGWFDGFVAGYTSDYHQFSCNVIGTLSEGKSLYDSLLYAIKHCKASGLSDPKNEFRVKGVADMSIFRVR